MLKKQINTKQRIALILVFISLILFFAAGSYAFFSYKNTESSESSIITDGVKLHYKEGTNSISLSNAMPMPEEIGIKQTEYFEFDVTGKTPNNTQTAYYITASKSEDSDDIDDAIMLSVSTLEYAEYDTYGIDLPEIAYNPIDLGVNSIKKYSVGDTITRDIYSIYGIGRNPVRYATKEECEASSTFREASTYNGPAQCFEEMGAYSVGEATSVIFYSEDECTAELRLGIDCGKRFSVNDIADRDIYEEPRIVAQSNNIEDCEAYNTQYYHNSFTCTKAYSAGDLKGEYLIYYDLYNELEPYNNDIVDLGNNNERILYFQFLPNDGTTYKKTYRIRMWINEYVDFTESRYNNASFKLKINVYGSGRNDSR